MHKFQFMALFISVFDRPLPSIYNYLVPNTPNVPKISTIYQFFLFSEVKSQANKVEYDIALTCSGKGKMYS